MTKCLFNFSHDHILKRDENLFFKHSQVKLEFQHVPAPRGRFRISVTADLRKMCLSLQKWDCWDVALEKPQNCVKILSATEIGRSIINFLKLLFFKIFLHFVKFLHFFYILPLISSIFVVLTLEMQKDSSRPKYASFLISLKRNDSQTFKSGCCKNPFLQCARYWYNLLRWMFYILCDNSKALLSVEVYHYSEIFEVPCCCFLWSQCFQRSLYSICYLHNNNDDNNKVPR